MVRSEAGLKIHNISNVLRSISEENSGDRTLMISKEYELANIRQPLIHFLLMA